jgi:DNA-binding SARP family transcriptional activator/Flp pilus assembly protein TadD
VEFRILGPLQVVAAGRSVALGGILRERILAALLLAAGRPVSETRLADIAYDDPPDGARRHVQNMVSELRKALAAPSGGAGPTVKREEVIVRHGSSYVLRVPREQVDVFVFGDLTAQARAVAAGGDKLGAARLLRKALGLWRGRALDGLDCDRLHQDLAGLEDARLAALEECLDLEMATTSPTGIGPLTSELRVLVAQYPLRQRLVGLLMTALYHAGQQTDALTVYQELATRLANEIGLDPNGELRYLHQAVLRDELPRPWPATAQAGRPVPAQLPLDLHGFVGRVAQLDTLDAIATAGSDQPTAMVISAVWGTAGVGKTTLAVHWAHRARDRFPDGQLYVNLRGFDPTGSVMAPAEAIRRFLEALGVPARRVPTDLDAQAALYRSQLAGRRMLVVLDNARDVEQVRPLLPGAPGCLVLVTSRNRLPGLVAADGARPLPLDLLTGDEARELLVQRVGADRVAAEPAAVADIVVRCVRLPLALAVVAGNAATQPQLSLAALADQLRNTHDRLDALSTGDIASTDLRTVFSWSYRALSQGAARLFRLLGGHPGPDISAPAAASLTGQPIEHVRPLLAELTRAHLLNQHSAGRYTLHDLLRAYAHQLTNDTETDEQRHAATRRLLDHYLHTAYPAALLLDPTRDALTIAAPQPGVVPEAHTDQQQAMAWFTAEHDVLLAVIDHAVATGFDTHTWQLVWTVIEFLDRRGHWHDYAAAGRAAVTAAQRLADPPVQARAHRTLAIGYTKLGRFDDAHAQLLQALDVRGQSGDLAGQAFTHLSIAFLRAEQGHHAESLDHNSQALALFRTTGHRTGQATALNAVGWDYAQLGDYRQALTYCEQSDALHRELGYPDGDAGVWDSLGYAHHHLGHYSEAITCYRNALNLDQDLSNQYVKAIVLTHLGDTHHASGDLDAARDAWQQALTILAGLERPDADAEADAIRAKLHELGHTTPADKWVF